MKRWIAALAVTGLPIWLFVALYMLLLTGCSAHKRVKPSVAMVAMDADKHMRYCHVEGVEWKCEGHR